MNTYDEPAALKLAQEMRITLTRIDGRLFYEDSGGCMLAPDLARKLADVGVSMLIRVNSSRRSA